MHTSGNIRNHITAPLAGNNIVKCVLMKRTVDTPTAKVGRSLRGTHARELYSQRVRKTPPIWWPEGL